MKTLRKAILYLWALPATALGSVFLIAALITGGGARIVQGVIEVHGGAAKWYLCCVVGWFLPGGATAMTLGHIVLGRDRDSLDRTRVHERIHVRQCERWGPLFIPAYLGASAWLWLRGADAYRDNPFEREAYENDDASDDQRIG